MMVQKPLEDKGKEACEKFYFRQKFKVLAKSGSLNNLANQYIGDLGVLALLESSHASDLTELNLDENNLSDKAVIALAKTRQLVNLRSLSLVGNHIYDSGAIALTKSEGLKNLNIRLVDINYIGED